MRKITRLLIQPILVQILTWADMVTILIFLDKQIFVIFVDFLIIEEKVALEVLMIVEDIGIITNHNVSYAVGWDML